MCLVSVGLNCSVWGQARSAQAAGAGSARPHPGTAGTRGTEPPSREAPAPACPPPRPLRLPPPGRAPGLRSPRRRLRGKPPPEPGRGQGRLTWTTAGTRGPHGRAGAGRAPRPQRPPGTRSKASATPRETLRASLRGSRKSCRVTAPSGT